MNVQAILSQPQREWRAEAPASENEIRQLTSRAKAQLPQEYLALLRFGNGGAGPLALPPLYLLLCSVQDCLTDFYDSDFLVEYYPDFIFFGSNGGLESIAFDLRSGPPWPIVMIDLNAGPESAQEIAPHMAAFIESIGYESE